jgi:hypothetical protein
MSRGLICIVAAGALAFAGCGTARRGDVDEIKRVAVDYNRALADGDGERACALMTREGQANVVRLGRDYRARECRDLAVVISALADKEQLDELRALRLVRVKVDGDRAVGQFEGMRLLEGTGVTDLRRVHGKWLIDAPRTR